MESTDSHDAQVQVPAQLPPAGSAAPVDASPANVAKPAVFAPGTIVGASYEVIELLGRGAMGMVYRVKHVTLPAEYALKILTDDKQDEVSVIRFQNEAQAIAKLIHPNIVAIYNFGLHDGSLPFYVMDLLAGEDLLDKIVYSGPMAPEMALPLFIEACAGLSFAHRKGILHRDVKPANLLILDRPDVHGASVKVVDFGIVKFAEELKPDSQKLTAMGIVCGSPSYMSPEQAMGQKVDPRSDIYSLGCSLFETLTGKVPFRGRSASDTMMMHVSAPSPSLASKNPEGKFSDDLEILVARMMAKERMYRYQTMEAVAQDLKNLLEGKPLASTPFVQSNFGVAQGKAEGTPGKHTFQQDEPLFDGGFTGEEERFTGEQEASGEYESEEDEADEEELVEEATAGLGLGKVALVSVSALAILAAASYFVYRLVAPPTPKETQQALVAPKSNVDMNYLGQVMPNVGDSEPDPKAASIELTAAKYFSKIVTLEGRKFVEFDFPAKSSERPLAWIGTTLANRTAAVGLVRIPVGGRICLVPSPDTILKKEFFSKFRPGEIAEVIINANYANDELVCAAAKTPGIEGFSILDCSTVSAKIISALNGIPGLIDLTLSSSRLGGRELAKLNCWPNLCKLNLSRSRNVSLALKQLSGTRSLQALDVTDCGIGSEDYRAIASLSSLRSLRLDKNKISNSEFRSLSKLSELTELSIVDIHSKDKMSFREIQHFPALRVVYVDKGLISKEDLAAIYQRCPRLRVKFYTPATTDTSPEMLYTTPDQL